MEEIKKNFTWSDIELLIKIKNSKEKEYLSMGSLAKETGILRSNPRFILIFNYLVKYGCITIKLTMGRNRLFSVNYKKLRDLIDEQDKINLLVNDYLSKDHYFTW